MELPEKPKAPHLSAVLIAAVIISLLIGGIFGYGMSSLTTSSQISSLQSEVSTLKKQVTDLQSTQGSSSDSDTYQNNTYLLGDNVSLSQLYKQVKDSVVMVQGILVQYDFFGNSYYSGVEGSGFVSNLTGQFVIITNYHVVQSAINVTVTFTDGDTYAANVTGTDPYADLAVLTAKAPQYEYKPLGIASSSTLKVGDPVFAVGNPLGYTGSMTSGIVSALGRTVSVSWSSYDIADCIQTTTPINPGNSGGPLLNYEGEVVGITSYVAVTSQGVAAQGLGLAIPSSTILRETESLITTSSYNSHPWLGTSGTSMDYAIAQAMNTNVTYGVLITQVTSGGPADKAGLRVGATRFLDPASGTSVTIGGDIVIVINDTRIKNTDDLSTYLEESTSPGQTISIVLVRNDENLTLSLTLGVRPPPT
ncbi:MAG: trypsin-like peptidase domain-containing protein [Candidatus Bathyarchaeia archaeon]